MIKIIYYILFFLIGIKITLLLLGFESFKSFLSSLINHNKLLMLFNNLTYEERIGIYIILFIIINLIFIIPTIWLYDFLNWDINMIYYDISIINIWLFIVFSLTIFIFTDPYLNYKYKDHNLRFITLILIFFTLITLFCLFSFLFKYLYSNWINWFVLIPIRWIYDKERNEQHYWYRYTSTNVDLNSKFKLDSILQLVLDFWDFEYLYNHNRTCKLNIKIGLDTDIDEFTKTIILNYKDMYSLINYIEKLYYLNEEYYSSLDYIVIYIDFTFLDKSELTDFNQFKT